VTHSRQFLATTCQVSGCWFRYVQALVRRAKKLGLTTALKNDLEVQTIMHCLMALPLLPASAIADGLRDTRVLNVSDSTSSQIMNRLLQYVDRQWIQKTTIGPQRLCVRDNVSRTNNILESYHAALRRRIQVAHRNLFSFLGHVQRLTVDCMKDKSRIDNGLTIRRPKSKRNVMNDTRVKTCIARYDSGTYSIMQFLKAVSHSVGAHCNVLQLEGNSNGSESEGESTEQENSVESSTTATSSQAPQGSSDTTESADCDVCLIAPRDSRIALVPCGHSRFCVACAERCYEIGNGCPICRASITMLLRIF